MSGKIISIVSAELVGEYRIHLKFDDGIEQTIDFKPFLTNNLHPSIRAYLNPGTFSSFHIEYGDLVWGDYDFCFPMIDLYHNKIDKTHISQEAA